MSRITRITETSAVVSLKVEGILTPETILAVEDECRQCLSKGKWVHLDVVDAQCVDRARSAMLRLMSADGLHVVRSSSPEVKR